MAEPLPIALEAIVPDDWQCKRSGIQWLVPHGAPCLAHQMIAYCVIAFTPIGHDGASADLLHDELIGFRLAFVARHDGVVLHAPESSRGGWHDQLTITHYRPGAVIGSLVPSGAAPAGNRGKAVLSQIVVGRRFTPLAEDRADLHSGWHDRRRAWRAGGSAPALTLLGLGICDLTGIVLGEENSGSELLALLPPDVHLVHVPDVPIVPTARIVAQQLRRGVAESDAIWADFQTAMATSDRQATPDDWMFGAALIKALCASPAGDSHGVFSPGGLARCGPADIVIMSLAGESVMRLRHRALGYDLFIHPFRFRQMPAALQGWISTGFEQSLVTIDRIRAEYLALIELLRPRRLMLLNCVSSLAGEDIPTYQGHDDLRLLATVWAKQLNQLGDELARDHGVGIIDADAIGAELGTGSAALDGIHQSRAMQQALREEIARVLPSMRDRWFSADLEIDGEKREAIG